jgi:hypothetical protein
MAVSIWMGGYAMLIADYIAISFLIVSVERLLRSGALFFAPRDRARSEAA